jgi:sedoheptulose-bisphosphatase
MKQSPVMSNIREFFDNFYGGASSGITASIFQSIEEISDLLANPSNQTKNLSGTKNSFGDEQLQLDIAADAIITRNLQNCPEVAGCCSEENPAPQYFREAPFFVSFDPLDGSSIVDCNFAVGAIFSVWHNEKIKDWIQGSKLLVNDQVLAVIAIFGPSIRVVARFKDNISFEATFLPNTGNWIVSKPNLGAVLEPRASTFALANLRAAADLKGYQRIVDWFVTEKKTLRYTGGLVPDVYQILCKGEGIFVSPTSSQTKAKLRVFFELAAVCFLFHSTGSVKLCVADKWVDGMSLSITDTEMRAGIILGSKETVEECLLLLETL